ncbi:MAG: DUF554 domain-containing protein [Chlorobia bacterium]|nr:DUF554 domain-containing protein [Fimbriimonadaceae bacterium]
MRGTLLNTATVAVGSTIGALAGNQIPDSYKELVLSGLGLVTIGLGVKLFLQSKNVLIVAAAISLGGMLGMAIGIQGGIESFADWAKGALGGEGRFAEGLVTASVLFCIGPTTILGCLQDGLEKKIELLALKSTLDLFAAMFLAASMGWGVLLSAAVVLVFQGALTLAAKPLRPLAQDQDLLAEVSGTGGIMMIAIGLSLLEIKKLPTADFLPAISLAPVMVVVGRTLFHAKSRQETSQKE